MFLPKINPRILFLSSLLTVFVSFSSTQEIFSLEASQALEELRWGVISYNNGLSAKALLALERAASLNPTHPLIQEWLGRTYWNSGLENAALDTWDRLTATTGSSSALQYRAETLRRRLNGEAEIPIEDQWVPLLTLHGSTDNSHSFQQPSVIRSARDGSNSLLLASYSSNAVLYFNANGDLLERFVGGVEGFDRPFDILPTGDGRLIVSEFQADKITVLSMEGYNRGYRIDTWGSRGQGEGEFLGPQYMALSPDEQYVYISDWGNRRIAKWNLEGDYILDFSSSALFPGFKGPTGIATEGDRVYIADSLLASVEVFDTAGNYLGPLVTEGLQSPEGLSIHKKQLYIADNNLIHRVDLSTGTLVQEASLGAGRHRITSVFHDENNNLLISDFQANQAVLMTPISTLYGGLNVILEHVHAGAHPKMFIDLSVTDRNGDPISGLDSSNFLIFDGDQPIVNHTLNGSSSLDSHVGIVAVTDLSGNADTLAKLSRGLRDLASELNPATDNLSLVSAGRMASLRGETTADSLSNLKALSSIGSQPVSWDEALRLSTSLLSPLSARKAIVALVGTAPTPHAFDRYGLIETARFMVNNGIIFYPIYVDNTAKSPELDYIATQTGAESYMLFRPEGTGHLVDEIRGKNTGRYSLAWNSPHSAGYGRAYLPVSVEVTYLNKSGRDESGAFAPLQ